MEIAVKKAPSAGLYLPHRADLEAWLRAWAELACRGGHPDPAGPRGIPGSANAAIRHVRQWAGMILDCAAWKEAGDAPRARIDDVGGGICLRWDGTFTSTRWVAISVADRGYLEIRVTWDSGTGRPSTFLAGVFGDLIDYPDQVIDS